MNFKNKVSKKVHTVDILKNNKSRIDKKMNKSLDQSDELKNIKLLNNNNKSIRDTPKEIEELSNICTSKNNKSMIDEKIDNQLNSTDETLK